MTSPAASVTLTATDAGGTTSFNTAGHWSNGQAPSAGNSYFTGDFTLRTPNPTTSGNNYIFLGDSLSVDAGGRFLGKIGNNVNGNTTAGTITITNLILNGGVFDQADLISDNASLTVAGNVTVNAASVLGAIGGTSSGSQYFDTLQFTAPISGSANLQISGSAANGGQDSGVVMWSAANPYSGAVTVTNANNGLTQVIASTVNGVFQLNNLNAVSNATLNLTALAPNPVSFASGVNTGPFNVGALAGGSTQSLADTAGSPVTLSVGGNNTSTTFSGALTGAGALTKVGAGTLTLAGTNAFAGNTTVGYGTLALAATGSITNSPEVLVAEGAILDVTANAFTVPGNQSLMGGGTIKGSVTAASGAGIYAGTASTYGTNTFAGNLTFASGAAAYLDVGPAYNGANGLIVVNGNLTLNGTVFYLSAPSASVNLDTGVDYTLMTVAGSISGVVASTPVWNTPPLNAANFSIIQTGNSIKLHYTVSAPPAGTLSLNPNTVTRDEATLASVTVTSSSHPISTVTLNASAIGGSSALPLIAAGGNVYTNSIAPGPGVSPGTAMLAATITDNTGASGSTPSATLTIAAASVVWSGGGADNNWSSNPNWQGGAAPGYVGDNVTFAGTTRLTPVMNANYSVTGVTFDGTAGSFILGSSGGDVLALNGGIANNSANAQTLNLSITNGGNLIAFAGGNNIAVDGGISGAGGLEDDNNAAVILNGTNTFTGNITINSGLLQIADAGLLGDGDYAGNITNNAALDYSSTATQTLSGVISNDGLTKDGTGKLILAGNNTYSGDTLINNGVLQVTGTLAYDANINYSGNVVDDGTFEYSGSASQTLSGSVSGTGGVVQDGTGTLTFNAANSYTGATVVGGGLFVLNPASVGYSPFGDLAVSNGAVTVNSAASAPIAVNGLALNNNAVLNLNYNFNSGNPSGPAFSAAAIAAPGTNIVINIGGVGPTVAQFPLISYMGAALPNLANFTLGSQPPGVTAVLVNNTANKSIDLNVTAVNPPTWVPLFTSDTFGNSSFNSAGNWQDGNPPSANNGYYTENFTLRTPADSNAYTFGGGALSIDTGGRFIEKGQNGQVITVTNLILNGGLMDYANLVGDGFTQTNAGNITLQSGLTSYLGALGGETLYLSASISGGGNVQIGGPQVNTGQDNGNVVLAGASTYTGATTIASGTVVVNGSLANTALTVTNSTLAGLGTIAGPVAVQAGATLAPGVPAVGPLTAGLGTLAVNNSVRLSGTAVMRINPGVSPASDQLAASSVIVNPSAVLVVTNIGSTNLVAGETFTLFSVGVSGAFATVTLPALPANVYWTNLLAVNGTIAVVAPQTINPNRTNITVSVSGGNLTLSWPQDHTGWTLQAQTNSRGVGLGTNWVNVPGSTGTNLFAIPVSLTNGSVFYRLKL